MSVGAEGRASSPPDAIFPDAIFPDAIFPAAGADRDPPGVCGPESPGQCGEAGFTQRRPGNLPKSWSKETSAAP